MELMAVLETPHVSRSVTSRAIAPRRAGGADQAAGRDLRRARAVSRVPSAGLPCYDCSMPWDPMRDLEAWHRLASPRLDSWAPPIDVYETADMFVVTAELPGLARDQIELAVEDHRLTIRGRRAERPASSPGGVRFHQVERGRGPFARTFEFADRIDAEGVTAELASGVLTVQLPKATLAPARRIDVG
jgi:HSP20 family protein